MHRLVPCQAWTRLAENLECCFSQSRVGGGSDFPASPMMAVVCSWGGPLEEAMLQDAVRRLASRWMGWSLAQALAEASTATSSLGSSRKIIRKIAHLRVHRSVLVQCVLQPTSKGFGADAALEACYVVLGAVMQLDDLGTLMRYAEEGDVARIATSV